jgi:hypothetical protein
MPCIIDNDFLVKMFGVESLRKDVGCCGFQSSSRHVGHR